MRRWLIAANILGLCFLVGYASLEFIAPLAAAEIHREEYKVLMFRCDQAMRGHYIAKRQVEVEPSDQSVAGLRAAEVGLLDCHDYDVLRKRMLKWQVSEEKLSTIGLEAMEQKSYELRRFVEIHEIRY